MRHTHIHSHAAIHKYPHTHTHGTATQLHVLFNLGGFRLLSVQGDFQTHCGSISLHLFMRRLLPRNYTAATCQPDKAGQVDSSCIERPQRQSDTRNNKYGTNVYRNGLRLPSPSAAQTAMSVKDQTRDKGNPCVQIFPCTHITQAQKYLNIFLSSGNAASSPRGQGIE